MGSQCTEDKSQTLQFDLAPVHLHQFQQATTPLGPVHPSPAMQVSFLFLKWYSSPHPSFARLSLSNLFPNQLNPDYPIKTSALSPVTPIHILFIYLYVLFVCLSTRG